MRIVNTPPPSPPHPPNPPTPPSPRLCHAPSRVLPSPPPPPTPPVFQREMVGPLGDVVHVSDILKGWGDEDTPHASSAQRSAATNNNNSGRRERLGSGTTTRGRGSNFGSGEINARPSWKNSARSNTSGWSSSGGVHGPGGGGGGKASIVSALERAMSRSTFGGGGGGGRLGESGATPQPQREKKRSEELFGTLMGQDGRGGAKGQGGWGHGGDGRVGGASGGKGEDGKSGEVDLGFLHRWGLAVVLRQKNTVSVWVLVPSVFKLAFLCP